MAHLKWYVICSTEITGVPLEFRSAVLSLQCKDWTLTNEDDSNNGVDNDDDNKTTTTRTFISWLKNKWKHDNTKTPCIKWLVTHVNECTYAYIILPVFFDWKFKVFLCIFSIYYPLPLSRCLPLCHNLNETVAVDGYTTSIIQVTQRYI